MKNKYDIFISYRREGGFETAQLIAQSLKHQGYNVFFDLENLREAGKFNTRLISVIENCKDFIVIFPPNDVERLNQDDDWVRQELACAIRHGKTIIPVLLRDFKFPKELPDDINEVRFYQGVAAGDYNYFDASLDKIKELLTSKKGITWDRYKPFFWVLLLFIGITAAFFGYRQWQGRKLFVATSIEQVKIMNYGITAMNVNLNIARAALEEWRKFATNFSAASPKDTAEIRNEFLRFIEGKKNGIARRNAMETLSEGSARILRTNGIQTEEINAFYEMALPLVEQEIENYLRSLALYARMPQIFDSFNQYAEQLYLSNEYMIKADYYAFLQLLTTLPEEVYETFKEAHSYLNNFKDIPLSLTYDDYEALGKAMLNECERVNSTLSGINNAAQQQVEAMEYSLRKTSEKMEQQILGDRMTTIEKKKADLETRKAELAEADKRLSESYERILKKFALQPGDGQWTQWGKMLRIATVAHNALVVRTKEKKEYDEQVKIAENQGMDPSFLTPPFHTVSLDEMFENINKWLDGYLNAHSSETTYVTAARHFYKAVKERKIPYHGVLVVSIENNATHPVLRPGDIIVERKGKPVRNVAHYGTLTDEPGENRLKILRFSADGAPRFTIETVPADCKIRAGIVDLTENE